MSRLLDPAPRVIVEAATGAPTRVHVPQRQRTRVVGVYARWRLESGWWREPLSRDYWKLGLAGPAGSTGPDLVCEVYFDRLTEEWFLARLYD
ncbi:MAG: hypothetical protein QOE92_380 [Chloroflexota bacterium]|nr:hypothetical protein [Chloroflexota bacterium]